MSIHHQDDTVTLHHGDCLDVLRTLPDASVDSVVTDPPYGLANTDPAHVAATITRWVNGERDYMPGGVGFMQAKWDAFVPPVAVWDECLRVLKPGGHVLTFAGTRTVDLMTLGLRLAGFEIRDSIAWLYGAGFSKGGLLGNKRDVPFCSCGEKPPLDDGAHRVACPRCGGLPEAFRGFSTTLKPAHEPIICARKPLAGTVAANVLEHGTGALNIDATRIDMGSDYDPNAVQRQSSPNAGMAGLGGSGYKATHEQAKFNAKGRWPTNVALDDAMGAELDEMSGERTSGKMMPTHTDAKRDVYGQNAAGGYTTMETYGDTGGASRFFKVISQTTSDIVFLPVECETWQPPGDASTRAANTSAGRSTESRYASSLIGGSGSKPTDPSPRDTRSTTGTTTPSTTTSTTSCASPPSGTTTTTSDSASSTDGPPELRSAAASAATPTSRSTPSPSDGLAPSRATAGSAPRHTAESGSPETATSSTHDDARSEHADSTPDFPTFRYQAKAPTRERPFYTAEDGSRVAHPTTKPLDLMRWLVRLVTPPGGTVLEPFAGSGTTVEACVVEGFKCVAVEKTDEYLPLTVARIHRRRDPVAAIKLAGDDLGLFTLQEDE